MLPVKLPHRLDRRPLLVSQTLAHLRTERRPMVSAHVRFKTRSEQRAHGRKHRLAAIHADSTLWHGSRSRLRLRCLHRGSGLRLHLRGHWRLRLSGGRKRHHRAQPNHHHLSLKFFHAFCFAAVLTRSSCCFYFRLLRFHARKGISGSGLCPVTMLRHLVNLQARIHSVKESRYFIYEFTSAPRPPRPCTIVVLHSGTHWATRTTLALCRGICLQWRCCLGSRGMAAPMIRPLMRILPFILGCLLAAIALPNPLHAQLVRENTPPPQQVSAKQDAQNAASTQIPPGK